MLPRPPAIRRLAALALMAVAVGLPVQAQDSSSVDMVNGERPCKRCLWLTGGLIGVGVVGSMIALDQAWYADYDRSALHSFNDGEEWMQMDKAGHVFSAYTLGAWGDHAFRNCGVDRRSSVWIGGTLGLVYLTGVELLDGTSANWGFSWWDMAANVAGAGLYIGQELGWEEQRITVKFSSHLTDYAAMRPDLLGTSNMERYLKDYNGQTIWLSGNLRAFSHAGRMPSWLNVAVGYGAEGMVTAFPPTSDDADAAGISRYRQLFLSPDLDLTRIRTRSKALRTTLFILNSIKIPMPTLEYRSTGDWVGHWLYF